MSVSVSAWATPPSGGTLFGGDQFIASVPAGGSAIVAASLDTSGLIGPTLIFVHVDPLDALDETNENNNLASAVFTISGDIPDLGFVLSRMPFFEETIPEGDNITKAVFVRNSGFADAPAFSCGVYEGDPRGPGALVIASPSYQTLAPGVETNRSFQFRSAGKLGSYPIFAHIDPANAVEEVNENDNLRQIGVFHVRAQITNASFANVAPIYFSPSIVQEGGTLNISFNVLNSGEITLENLKARLWMGPPSDPESTLIGETIHPLLQRARSAAFAFSLENAPAGEHVFFAVIDPDDTVTEEDETDNVASGSFTVKPPLPNLKGVEAKPVLEGPGTDPYDQARGKVIPVRFTFTNDGLENTPAGVDFVVRLYAFDPFDANDPGVVVGEQTTGPLNRSTSRTVDFTWDSSGYTKGAVAFTAVADADGAIEEFLDSDNGAGFAMEIHDPASDPLIRAPDISWSNPRPAAGETVTATIVIRNEGDLVDASDVTVRFYNGDPSGGGALLGEREVAVPAGSFSNGYSGNTVTFTYDWPVPAGLNEFFVELTDDTGTELNEDNNLAMRPLTGLVADRKTILFVETHQPVYVTDPGNAIKPLTTYFDMLSRDLESRRQRARVSSATPRDGISNGDGECR